MSFVERLVAHLARHDRITSTGEIAISLQGVLNFPAAVGVPRRLTTRNFTTKAEHLQLRIGEYGMAAIDLALSAVDIHINIEELTEKLSSRLAASDTMHALQDRQPAPSVEVPAELQVEVPAELQVEVPAELQVVESNEARDCANPVAEAPDNQNAYRHLSQEDLISAVCERDDEIRTLKMNVKKAQILDWKLQQHIRCCQRARSGEFPDKQRQQ